MEEDDVDMDVDDDETSSDEESLIISEVVQTPNIHAHVEIQGVPPSASTSALTDGVSVSRPVNGNAAESLHTITTVDQAATTLMNPEP